MHSNFIKAFECSKRKDYMNARNLYHDLLLDIHTYSDYYLLKELIYLLDVKIAQKEQEITLESIIKGYTLINNQNEIQSYKAKKDNNIYSYIILLEKGFFKNSYIGIDEANQTISMYCFVGKNNFVIKNLSLDTYYIFISKGTISSYQSGCQINTITEQRMKVIQGDLIKLFNNLLFYYHVQESIQLINPEMIHKYYKKVDDIIHIDLSRFEYINFQNFKLSREDIDGITHYLKLMGPLTWLSDQNGVKIPVEDLQYDLLGEKWCNHRLFNEWLALLKLMPYIQFGKSLFIRKDSYYLPYEQSYYIERNITRLEDDRVIDA